MRSSIRYDVYGAAVGVGLPVLGTALEAWTRHGGLSPASLAAAYASQPLLWIMATTPFVLGGLGRLLVRQHAQIARQAEALVAMEQAKRESYQRTASELFTAAQGLLGNASFFTRTAAETAGRVKETSATLHALGQTASANALSAEEVIGLALSAERAGADGRREAEAASVDLVRLADEVRGLATRIEALDAGLAAVLSAAGPTPLAGPLGEALASVQRTMGGAVELAGSGLSRAAAGAATAARTAQTVQRLADVLTSVARAAREIARVAQQQEGGIEQAQRTVAGIALDTEATQAATREVEQGARALTDLANALRRAVKAGGEVPQEGAPRAD